MYNKLQNVIKTYLCSIYFIVSAQLVIKHLISMQFISPIVTPWWYVCYEFFLVFLYDNIMFNISQFYLKKSHFKYKLTGAK